MTGVILDTIIASLLLVTVVYCIRLSRKITLLHQGKEELNQFIHEFNHAILRAEDNIAQLGKLGGETNEKLQEHVKNARFLANDLSFLMEKGNKISQSLEHNISMSRSAMTLPQRQKKKDTPSTSAQPVRQENGIPSPNKNSAQQEKAKQIEALLKEAKNIKPTNNNSTKSNTMTEEKRQALDNALSQIASQQRSTSSTANNSKKAPITKTPPTQKTNDTTIQGKADTSTFNSSRLKQTLLAAQSGDKK